MSKPKHKAKVGGIILWVWENEATVEGKLKILTNITIKRAYLDKEGKWPQSQGKFHSDRPTFFHSCIINCDHLLFSRLWPGNWGHLS